MNKIKDIIKNIQVKPVLMAREHFIDIELFPTFGFIKKANCVNVETNEPAGVVYAVGISWLVFALAITYKQEE